MKRNKKNMQPAWRPNFVNQSELPDIKVIRTNFIINMVAAALALSMVFVLAKREYSAAALETTIDRLEERIAGAEAADKKNLELSREFKQAAEYILEVGRFSEAPFSPHELLYHLSVIQPDDVIYRSINLSEGTEGKGKNRVITYRVNLNGDAKNLTVLDEFKDILAQAEGLQFPGYGIKIDETLEGRDERTGIFPYRMTISFTPQASDKKERKDAT